MTILLFACVLLAAIVLISCYVAVVSTVEPSLEQCERAAVKETRGLHASKSGSGAGPGPSL